MTMISKNRDATPYLIDNYLVTVDENGYITNIVYEGTDDTLTLDINNIQEGLQETIVGINLDFLDTLRKNIIIQNSTNALYILGTIPQNITVLLLIAAIVNADLIVNGILSVNGGTLTINKNGNLIIDNENGGVQIIDTDSSASLVINGGIITLNKGILLKNSKESLELKGIEEITNSTAINSGAYIIFVDTTKSYIANENFIILVTSETNTAQGTIMRCLKDIVIIPPIIQVKSIIQIEIIAIDGNIFTSNFKVKNLTLSTNCTSSNLTIPNECNISVNPGSTLILNGDNNIDGNIELYSGSGLTNNGELRIEEEGKITIEEKSCLLNENSLINNGTLIDAGIFLNRGIFENRGSLWTFNNGSITTQSDDLIDESGSSDFSIGTMLDFQTHMIKIIGYVDLEYEGEFIKCIDDISIINKPSIIQSLGVQLPYEVDILDTKVQITKVSSIIVDTQNSLEVQSDENFIIEENVNLIMADETSLKILANGKLTIEDKGSLTVVEGASLDVNDLESLIVSNGGKLKTSNINEVNLLYDKKIIVNSEGIIHIDADLEIDELPDITWNLIITGDVTVKGNLILRNTDTSTSIITVGAIDKISKLTLQGNNNLIQGEVIGVTDENIVVGELIVDDDAILTLINAAINIVIYISDKGTMIIENRSLLSSFNRVIDLSSILQQLIVLGKLIINSDVIISNSNNIFYGTVEINATLTVIDGLSQFIGQVNINGYGKLMVTSSGSIELKSVSIKNNGSLYIDGSATLDGDIYISGNGYIFGNDSVTMSGKGTITIPNRNAIKDITISPDIIIIYTEDDNKKYVFNLCYYKPYTMEVFSASGELIGYMLCSTCYDDVMCNLCHRIYNPKIRKCICRSI